MLESALIEAIVWAAFYSFRNLLIIPSTSFKCSSSRIDIFERIQSIRNFLSTRTCLPLCATAFPEGLGDVLAIQVAMTIGK